MGSYGIGPARIMAAAVEQYADDAGISWPRSIAPWDVELVTLAKPGEPAREVADRLYGELKREGLDVLYDERTASAGEKFADAELLGVPAAADGRQARHRGGRGRGADPARPGEAVAAARRGGGGRRGAVARTRLTTRRLLGLDRSGGPPPETQRGAAAQPVDDPERDRLRPAGADPGLPRSWRSTPTTGGSRRAVDRLRGDRRYRLPDGIAARLTGQYSRLGALLDPLTDRALVISGVVVCWHFELLPRWALAVLAAREALMLVLTELALRHDLDLNINMLGRWAVWPTMFCAVLRDGDGHLGRRVRCSTSAWR